MCGVLAATSVGFVANLFKQNQLYPVASGYDASDKDKRQGGDTFVPAVQASAVPLPALRHCFRNLEVQALTFAVQLYFCCTSAVLRV
jgi:hypothetical protein